MGSAGSVLQQICGVDSIPETNGVNGVRYESIQSLEHMNEAEVA